MNQQRLHAVMTVAWALLVIPTLAWWRESILWVAFMSLYANVVGHWGAYQAARIEDNGTDTRDPLDKLYKEVMGI